MRFLVALLLVLALPAHAGQVQVAAAANLAAPIQKIAAAFQRETGHVAVVALGSTGKFHAQVRNGAPFEVLLAADAETPRRLEAEGLARPGTRFTYAIGQLVLWSAQPGMVDANAAVETLKNLGLLAAWERRFAHAENIAQAYQFAASGNAQIAFVALSQVTDDGQRVARGSGWIVPENLHTPIRQDAVLLNPGAGN